MRYKLKEIPPEGLTVGELVPAALLDEALVDTDARPERAGQLHVQLFKNGSDVVATGKLSAALTLPCSRCVGAAEVRLDIPVQAVFVPEEHAQDVKDAKDDDEIDPDEPDRLTHDRVAVDLTPLVRDLLIVNLPMTALCKDDCRGLCAECGQDLNVAECGHKPVELPSTSPLAVLAQLGASPKQ